MINKFCGLYINRRFFITINLKGKICLITLIAEIGNFKIFFSLGYQLASWIGVVPKVSPSADELYKLRITKWY
jgi:hypothetical protein